MTFTAKDWIALVFSSLFAYIVFGNISAKAGYPRWHGFVMPSSGRERYRNRDFRVLRVAH